MPGGVKAAQESLELLDEVRILAGQPCEVGMRLDLALQAVDDEG